MLASLKRRLERLEREMGKSEEPMFSDDYEIAKQKTDIFLASLAASAAVKTLRNIYSGHGHDIDPIYRGLELSAEAVIRKLCLET